MMKRNGNLTSGDTDEVDVVEIAYWRKRRHIQNWMEEKCRELGKTGQFNCVALDMTHKLLDKLEKDVAHNKLDEYDASGFFYGSFDFTEEDERYLLSTILECRKAIDSGWHVYYDSWWQYMTEKEFKVIEIPLWIHILVQTIVGLVFLLALCYNLL